MCKMHAIIVAFLIAAHCAGCAGQAPASGGAAPPVRVDAREARAAYHEVGDVALGEPLAVSVDIRGNIFIADGIPGRIVQFDPEGTRSIEFQDPSGSPGFYPTDCKLQGFFLYAVDEVNRTVLRFDQDGAYRDILLTFSGELAGGGRVSPVGLDVDASGRIAVTDVENHRVLIYDAYLSLEVVFGSYGSYEGQLNGPRGICFTRRDRLLVADTGNRRIVEFDDAGTFLRTIPPADTPSPLVRPRRAVMDGEGRVYVADPAAGAVFLFDEDGRPLAGIVPAGAGRFEPTDIAVVDATSLYITDAASRTLYIFKVD
jgi:DNA-binding beta-propeller fold protein YncE